MKRVRKIIFFILIWFFVLGIPIFTFGILNTMVSLKYETENPTDCISFVTGQDLCLTIQVLKSLIITSVITIILLAVFRKRTLQ